MVHLKLLTQLINPFQSLNRRSQGVKYLDLRGQTFPSHFYVSRAVVNLAA